MEGWWVNNRIGYLCVPRLEITESRLMLENGNGYDCSPDAKAIEAQKVPQCNQLIWQQQVKHQGCHGRFRQFGVGETRSNQQLVPNAIAQWNQVFWGWFIKTENWKPTSFKMLKKLLGDQAKYPRELKMELQDGMGRVKYKFGDGSVPVRQ